MLFLQILGLVPVRLTWLRSFEVPPDHFSYAGQPAILAQLLLLQNWLYDGELALLDAFISQLRHRSLSDTQPALLEDFARRAQRRNQVKIIPGGALGSGKRR
jgi:hypothetical protein